MPPAGRPLKRPGDATGAGPGPGDDSSSLKLKIPRVERIDDFSSIVKNKLHSYTRTGQACDRCKVRKIRCDALPEGCSHCISQSLECYVTDRVTGRTERRGYLQELEREKSDMLAHIRDLEGLLRSNGIEVAPWQWSSFGRVYPSGMVSDATGHPVNDPASKDRWTEMGSVWVKNHDERKAQTSAPVPSSRSGLESMPTEGHLGVTADNAPLSSVKGTQLSILGMTIDIASFDAPDIDEPPPGAQITTTLYNKSVQAFWNSVMRVNPRLDVPLPSRKDAFTYAEWYFMVIMTFTPVLHKPSFINLLTRVYDDPSFQPTISELVIVHIVFATIYFHYGVRNREEPEKQAHLNGLSNKHYHWCLGRFYELASDSTLTAVQALALITIHTRCFPKPGCATLVAAFAFNKAVELNLHRTVRQPGESVTLQGELQKRAWWSILLMNVTLNGRLGRPMPIMVTQFDCDFPVVVPEECLTDQGITDPSRIGESPFLSGLIGYKIVPAFLELFNAVYSVRRDPSTYADTIRRLESQYNEWLQGCPDDLDVDKCKPSMKLFALYNKAVSLEFELCLRHPSASLTDDPALNAENFRKCESAAKGLLKVATQLLKMKCLDTTWYQLSVYVAAAFSQLVCHWKRRFGVTPAEVAVLQTEMDMWLAIISEIGVLLGSGTEVTNQVALTIQQTISWIEHDMPRNGAAQQQQHLKQQPQPAPRPLKQESFSEARGGAVEVPGNTPGAASRNTIEENGIDRGNSASNGTFFEIPLQQAAPSYPQHLGFADHGGPVQATISGASNISSYDPNDQAYMYSASVGTGHDQNPLVVFASQAAQQVSNHAAAAAAVAAAGGAGDTAEDWTRALGGGNAWQDWTTAIAQSQDRYSANALLTLGSGVSAPSSQRDHGVVGGVAVADMNGGSSGDDGTGGVAAATHAGQWPLVIFHDGSGPISGG